MSDKIRTATLASGKTVDYVVTDNPPSGTMKYIYFTTDRKYVVQFFNKPEEAELIRRSGRLDEIVNKYNPTKAYEEGGPIGSTRETADYFKSKFSWPIEIIESPEFGILCPTYPSNYFFDANASNNGRIPKKGQEKEATWFVNPFHRKFLNDEEKGNFQLMLKICITLARSIRRMHMAGLAHSDLSPKNVLIDPKRGECIIIDIDSLVVPGKIPPEVLGTPEFMAPELYKTMALDINNPDKITPSTMTDLHSMAVLIYQYLLLRHPLKGSKRYSGSAEEEVEKQMGSEALFIENPYDKSNYDPDIQVTIDDLGDGIKNLFLRAFVDGLHNPNKRPTAAEWERELVKSWDLLQPCDNPNCSDKWFILHDPDNPVCPCCGKRVADYKFLTLHLMRKSKLNSSGYVELAKVNIYDQKPLFKWHFYDFVVPNEKEMDRSPYAYIVKQNGDWLLVNKAINNLVSPHGNPVPIDCCLHLQNGSMFSVNEENGFVIKVTNR